MSYNTLPHYEPWFRSFRDLLFLTRNEFSSIPTSSFESCQRLTPKLLLSVPTLSMTNTLTPSSILLVATSKETLDDKKVFSYPALIFLEVYFGSDDISFAKLLEIGHGQKRNGTVTEGWSAPIVELKFLLLLKGFSLQISEIRTLSVHKCRVQLCQQRV